MKHLSIAAVLLACAVTVLPITAAETAATYEELKDFVLSHFGFRVTSLYISQVKRKCGLPVGECYYHPKNPNPIIPQCPPVKEAARNLTVFCFSEKVCLFTQRWEQG